MGSFHSGSDMAAQPARNFTRLAVAIVVAAVVISATVLSYSSFAATVTKTTTTVSTSTVITTVTTSFSVPAANGTGYPCATTFTSGVSMQAGDWSGSGGNRSMRIFLMPANVTAQLCVMYTVFRSQPSSSNISLAGQIETVNFTYGHGGYAVNSINPALGITDRASPPSVIYNSGIAGSKITVVYTITASPSTTGIYALGFPSTSCPPWIPVSVGYSPAEAEHVVTMTSYQSFLVPSGCVISGPLSSPTVIGVSGMDVAWVNATS